MEIKYVLGLEDLKLGSKGQSVYVLQTLLNALGYSCGTADGIWGSKTTTGVLKFKKAKGLSQTAICDQATWDKVFNSRKGA